MMLKISHFRDHVENNNYSVIEDCSNVANLTSVLKLFLREMPTALITTQILNDVKTGKINLFEHGNIVSLVSQLKRSLASIDAQSFRVLRYILQHAKRVADAGTNILCFSFNVTIDLFSLDNHSIC